MVCLAVESPLATRRPIDDGNVRDERGGKDDNTLPNVARPNTFVVGLPKCGTTSLYDFLHDHPDVFMSAPKEPHYFATDLDSCEQISSERDYLQLFADAGEAPVVGEAYTWNLYSKDAARNIARLCPDAKIIICLRNPVDLIYSLHAQNVYNGSEDIEDFEAALDAEHGRTRSGKTIVKQRFPIQQLFYRDVAHFGEQIVRYQAAFPPEQLQFILLDDIARRQEETFARVCSFLGIRPLPADRTYRANGNKRLRSSKLSGLLRDPSASPLWRCRGLIPVGMRRRIAALLWQVNTRQAPRPPVAPDLLANLAAEFRSEVAHVSHLIGIEASRWDHPVAALAAAASSTETGWGATRVVNPLSH